VSNGAEDTKGAVGVGKRGPRKTPSSESSRHLRVSGVHGSARCGCGVAVR
jgi:hypothetical protein